MLPSNGEWLSGYTIDESSGQDLGTFHLGYPILTDFSFNTQLVEEQLIATANLSSKEGFKYINITYNLTGAAPNTPQNMVKVNEYQNQGVTHTTWGATISAGLPAPTTVTYSFYAEDLSGGVISIASLRSTSTVLRLLSQ